MSHPADLVRVTRQGPDRHRRHSPFTKFEYCHEVPRFLATYSLKFWQLGVVI